MSDDTKGLERCVAGYSLISDEDGIEEKID